MSKMSIRVIFKCGAEFTIKCDKFALEKTALGEVTSYDISGIAENKPIYLDFNQVAAVVRICSDEND